MPSSFDVHYQLEMLKKSCPAMPLTGFCEHFHKKPGPGDPAAHRIACLPLLPSGPGGVHKILLHRAQPLYNISVTNNMAERVGFELTVPSPVHVISNHADSATLAPLRTLVIFKVTRCYSLVKYFLVCFH